jgi:hypothetical protein
MTARIHWARIALAAAVTLIASAAEAQNTIYSPHTMDPEAGLPLYKRTMMPPDGWLPPDQRLLVALSKAALPPPAPVVMNGGMGGVIGEHQSRFWALKHSGAPVEMRGGCWSACTLITSFIPKERLCFAPGAFLAFHAARTIEAYPRLSPHSTYTMYASYPAEIRNWIDDHGGVCKLTVETFWTMYDRDLWAIGYPRCK